MNRYASSTNEVFWRLHFSLREFESQGLNGRFVENNISHNHRRSTLRGLHYQAAPYAQAKLARCTRGSILDIVVDLRPSSPTFREWVGNTLSAENLLMMYLPGDVAHGFQSLENKTEDFYQVSEFYRPEASRGLRWNDPAFSIKWPLPDKPIILPRDSSYPDFKH